jgi:hypothetical protein
MSTKSELADMIEQAVPYRGACYICGCDDARHRVFNAIKGRVLAGEDPASEVEDYGYSFEVIKAIVKLPYKHPLHDPSRHGLCHTCGNPINRDLECDHCQA